jgi:hypothetical protein
MPTMSEKQAPDSADSEAIYVPHAEFRAGLPAGQFRLIVNPERAKKYVKHRLMLTALILPLVGTGIGMAYMGYRWLGLCIVIVGVAAHRLVAMQAPRILLHMIQRDSKIYHEALEFEILEVRRAK